MANNQLMSTLPTKPEPQKKQQEQLKAQTKSEITPVKSSLPPIQQAGMASASQVSAATKDPRFTQAITQKYQQDIQRQSQALKEQQHKQPVQPAQSGVGRQKIAQLLNRINNPSSSAEDVAQATSEYQQLMAQQAPIVEESPESKAARANLAALSRLSGGAQLASAYGVGPVTGATAAGLQPDGTLTGALMSAKQQALAAERDAAISEQQLQLEKNRLAQLKALGGVAAAGEQTKLLRELSGAAEADKKLKEDAFTRVKEGVLLGKGVSESDLNLLGITPAQASEMVSFNLGEIEGLVPEGQSIPENLEDLETAVKNLRSNIPQDQMTQEQKDLINYYDRIQSEFTRNIDSTSEYAFATPEQKARINALRRLTGQSDISDDAIGGGAKSGKVEFPSIFKDISESEKRRKESAMQEALSPEAEKLYLEQSRTFNQPDNIKKLVDNFNTLYSSKDSISGDEMYKYITRYGTFDKPAASHMKNVYKDVLKSTKSQKLALDAVQKILRAELDKARTAAEELKNNIDYKTRTTTGFTRALNIGGAQ